MPRQKRRKSSLQMYHVIIRGADHQLFFQEPKDYKKYLDLLDYFKSECQFKIYAYCLMSNHVHLLIHSPLTPLETIFRRLNTSYAGWYNLKYQRTGYLQNGRYGSEPIEDTSYLLAVVRYIHNNPKNAGIEIFAGESYPWNSIFDYRSAKSSLTDTDFLFALLGGKENFDEFQGIEDSTKCLDICKMKKRIPDDVARDKIFELCNCHTTIEFQKLSTKEQKQYLLLLHKEGISIRQLNRLTGISRGTIERIVCKKIS